MIEVKLTKGQVTVIDDTDGDLCNISWYAKEGKTKGFYAVNKTSKLIFLHRVILSRILDRPLLRSEECDHIDLNKLNNTRENLRLATHQENQRNKSKYSNNTSGYKGVYWCKTMSKWEPYIVISKKTIHLGYFDDIREAVRVRNEAEIKYFSNFSRIA